MPDSVIRISFDATAAKEEIELLADLAQRSPKFRQRLLDLSESGGELFRLDMKPAAAGGADEFRACLQMSDRLRELVAATGAGDV